MTASTIPDEQTIRDFWDSHPCGDRLVERLQADYEAFFQRYDAYRYNPDHEGHIPGRLDAIEFKGKRVLEIGLGQGAESEQMIRRSAVWSGLDLTPESVARVRIRLRLRQLPHESLKCGSALDIPFSNGRFDIVFSHGVLHHIPEVEIAQREIARVLKPDGQLIVMLYARRSLNYLLAIAIVRRLALLTISAVGARPGGIIGAHLSNAKRVGLWRYLQMSNFIHRNTDGPANPYSKVYDLARVRADFPAFEIERSNQNFMHAPPLPVRWLKPLAGVLGWHMWVHLKPRSPEGTSKHNSVIASNFTPSPPPGRPTYGQKESVPWCPPNASRAAQKQAVPWELRCAGLSARPNCC
jgi:SAM-dependent methyltransferase